MPAINPTLHGNAPDKARVALLLIDVINDLEFDDGDKLLIQAIPMAQAIAKLKQRAKQADLPVVYVNDNFGRWQSNFHHQVKHCLRARGQPIVELLQPEEDDYFVLKPKYSGFYSTALDVLLTYLGVHSVILTGIAANICVLFTANDAYMRDLQLIVPQDCVASNTANETRLALAQMALVLKADIRSSADLDIDGLNGNRG